MGALGGMRRNVEVKARLRAREEALRAALRLRGLGPVCPVCPGAGQGPSQVCPGAGQGPPQVCPGGGPGTGEGQEPPQVCPGGGPGTGEGQEPPQVCPGGGQVLLQTDTFFRVPRGRLKLRQTQAVLSQSLGVLGTVRKERLLFLLGQTRLHLDRVQGLGDFLELEVVLRPEQSEEDGQRLARELLQEFGIGEQDLISGAYLDLLLAQGDNGDTP
ncbi:uncharacterized protein LOC143694181 isoform X3 [Agelaius phoeniceus]|uniref:uncharacterized protein LOC143694181 isoform X3 n=1 Tax=Agelaius phoeniceus TaxID=39638 RepID=UPI004054E1E2